MKEREKEKVREKKECVGERERLSRYGEGERMRE